MFAIVFVNALGNALFLRFSRSRSEVCFGCSHLLVEIIGESGSDLVCLPIIFTKKKSKN